MNRLEILLLCWLRIMGHCFDVVDKSKGTAGGPAALGAWIACFPALAKDGKDLGDLLV